MGRVNTPSSYSKSSTASKSLTKPPSSSSPPVTFHGIHCLCRLSECNHNHHQASFSCCHFTLITKLLIHFVLWKQFVLCCESSPQSCLSLNFVPAQLQNLNTAAEICICICICQLCQLQNLIKTAAEYFLQDCTLNCWLLPVSDSIIIITRAKQDLCLYFQESRLFFEIITTESQHYSCVNEGNSLKLVFKLWLNWEDWLGFAQWLISKFSWLISKAQNLSSVCFKNPKSLQHLFHECYQEASYPSSI